MEIVKSKGPMFCIFGVPIFPPQGSKDVLTNQAGMAYPSFTDLWLIDYALFELLRKTWTQNLLALSRAVVTKLRTCNVLYNNEFMIENYYYSHILVFDWMRCKNM